jgi:transglutaminase-like putative cysteine protease
MKTTLTLAGRFAARLGHLPREARDTLFLLAVIAWTLLPHVDRLPLWCSLLAASVLLWRMQLALNNAALPGRWWLATVLVAAAVLTFWSHRTLLGKEAGVTLIVVLTALKTLELRARRDAFVIFFLGFFLILTHFLYSQSLLTAAAMLISIWGLLTALVLAHMPVGQPALKQAGTLAARAALLGAPLMVLLFVLFPRVGPLWGVPQDASGRTGLSNEMRFGSVNELATDDRVAMVLRFPSGRPPAIRSLYFRGPVFGHFDGKEWRPVEARLNLHGASAGAEVQLLGTPTPYEAVIEPQRSAILPLLDVTTETPAIEGGPDNLRAFRRDDLQWLTNRAITERVRVTGRAWTEFRHGPSSPGPELAQFVELPANFNPRTLAWAEALRAEPRLAKADARTLANAVMQHIRTAGFSYTLSPGLYGENGSPDVIDEFWLDRKQGFCEHFAAAFVVVMRAMDVPARVVTGYQGAEINPFDGNYVVRNSFAHAWAEYWQPGVGWLRADPTAAVAPDRVERARNLRPPPGLMASAIGTMNPALLRQMREFWDAVNNQWNRWVLSYSRGTQLDLLKELGFGSPSWEDLAYLLIGALASLSLAGALWAWWDQRRMDPWLRAYGQVRRALEQATELQAPPHLPPRSLAAELLGRYGAGCDELAQALQAFESLRYGPEAARRSPRETATLARGLARRIAALAGQLPQLEEPPRHHAAIASR